MPTSTRSTRCWTFPEVNQPWKIVVVLAGIFLAGGVTGGFVALRFFPSPHPARQGSGPDQWAPRQMKRLAERLELTPDQQERLHPIVRRNMEELIRLRLSSTAHTREIFERMEREISEQLTPAQRPKFEQMNREFREKFRRAGPERGNGDGPRPVRDRPAGEPDRPGNEPPPPPDKPAGGG